MIRSDLRVCFPCSYSIYAVVTGVKIPRLCSAGNFRRVFACASSKRVSMDSIHVATRSSSMKPRVSARYTNHAKNAREPIVKVPHSNTQNHHGIGIIIQGCYSTYRCLGVSFADIYARSDIRRSLSRDRTGSGSRISRAPPYATTKCNICSRPASLSPG